ncbi:hypothetical protein [Pseudomonas piscis]|uniref:hypothetical protein n=1 Tax=Pseudomonas piscis TaxID=2614538 RepID=UPI0021D5B84E|nr:hypothetical protein [Pseudomonas piscis]MCU7648586.1 hypothetical protein [Pseudomonas piscis]
MKKLAYSLKASATVYDAGTELYYLSYSRQKYGDEAVLNLLRQGFGKREELGPADACIRAGQFLKDIDRLEAREFHFEEMRDTLDQQSDKQKELDRETSSSNTTVF